MNSYVDSVINERILNEEERDRRLITCIEAASGFNRYADRSKLYGNRFFSLF